MMQSRLFLKTFLSPRNTSVHKIHPIHCLDSQNKKHSRAFLELMKKAMFRVKVNENLKKRHRSVCMTETNEEGQHSFIQQVEPKQKRKLSLKKNSNYRSLIMMDKKEIAIECPQKQKQSASPTLQNSSPKLKSVRLQRNFNIKLRNSNRPEILIKKQNLQNSTFHQTSVSQHLPPITQRNHLNKKKPRKISIGTDYYLEPWVTNYDQQNFSRHEF